MYQHDPWPGSTPGTRGPKLTRDPLGTEGELTAFGAKILANSEEAATNGTASQAVTWSQQAMNLWPIFVLITGFLAVVVLAIYQRELR